MCVIGIDPGLTRTGVVVMDDVRTPIGYATFAADEAHHSSAMRAWDLADRIFAWLEDLLYNYREIPPVLAIEKPIMGRNVENYEKQMRLFQSIITVLGPFVDKIMEYNPVVIKKAATGDGKASKLDIICASPLDGPGNWGSGDKEMTANQEAVCDAWAIAACVYTKARAADSYAPPPNGDESRGPIVEQWFD